jgi:hypothetical protein
MTTQKHTAATTARAKKEIHDYMNGYLGWAADNMYGDDENQVKIGDKIAILVGCSATIVIRPHGSYSKSLVRHIFRVLWMEKLWTIWLQGNQGPRFHVLLNQYIRQTCSGYILEQLVPGKVLSLITRRRTQTGLELVSLWAISHMSARLA